MKNPKEIVNQLIVEDDLFDGNEHISEKPSELDDYTWDDNKQHTEQNFF
jgi:hypothetical protein